MQKKLFSLISVLFLSFMLLAGCGSHNSPVKESTQTPYSSPQAKTAPVSDDRKLIHTAKLALETYYFSDSEKRIKEMTEKHAGLIESENVTADNEGRKDGLYVIRIPQNKLSEALAAYASLPQVTVKNRSQSAQDVTDEYIDVNARLENLKLQEKRLREILSQAKTVDDIIKIEAELTKVRTQLDAAATRLKNLTGRIEMSTLTITLKETRTAASLWSGYGEKILTAFADGFRAAGDTLLGTITVIIGISPAMLILYGLWHLWKKVRSKRQANQQIKQ
ncbi:MAG: DUF4349 domain-containing protein [Negativicutes bacterium]|nr:DUF4349 domain-containing protein [Negativicutes bacterium]